MLLISKILTFFFFRFSKRFFRFWWNDWKNESPGMTLLVLGLSCSKSQPTDTHFLGVYVCTSITNTITNANTTSNSKSQPTDTHFFGVYVCGPTFACEPILMKPTETFNSNQYSCSTGRHTNPHTTSITNTNTNTYTKTNTNTIATFTQNLD